MMSTNCIRCVVETRTGPDLLCDRCRNGQCDLSRRAQIGDRGQRFEVVSIDPEGKRRVWGWTDVEGGGVLAESARMHPWSKSVEVFDRHPRGAE